MSTKTILALIAASAATLSFGSPSAIAAPEYTWAESYGFKAYGSDGKPSDDPFYGSGFDVPVGIAQMPDGGFVVAGQFDPPELYANVFSSHTSEHSCAGLIRYDADGTILWQRILRQTNDSSQSGYFYPASSHVTQIATDPKGNIFIAGGKGNVANGGTQPFVAKFSAAGGLLWDNGIKETTWVVGDNPPTYQAVPAGAAFNTMALTSDGGVLAGTTEYLPSGGQSRPSVAKFNSDGSLAMHAIYEVAVQYIGVSAVGQRKGSSNYLVAINHPESGSFSPNPHGMTLLEIAPGGKVLREIVFSPEDGRVETPLQIVATSDGGIATFSQLAKGYSGGTVYDAGGFLLRKLDANLNPTFQKTIERTGATSGFYANHLSLMADGGFLIAGHNGSGVQNDVGYDEVSLTRVSATGDLLSVSVIGGPKNEGVSSYGPSSGAFALQAADGGYAFTTASDSYGETLNGGFSARPDVWVGKTDANRRIQNFKDDMRELQLTQFNVRNNVQTGDKEGIYRRGDVTGETPTSQPAFILENPAHNAAPNAPTIKFQATPLKAAAMPPVPQFTTKTSPISTDGVTYSPRQEWRFEAIDLSTVPGLTLRVQYSKQIYNATAPNVESTWTDLPGGGQMTLVDPVNGYWRLDTTGVVPEVQEDAQNYFFRVLASAPGYFSSTGPAQNFYDDYFSIATSPLGTAPVVSITSPGDGSSVAEHSSVAITASAASSKHTINSVTFLDDGRVVGHASDTTAPSVTINDISGGLHVLSAVALDSYGLETTSTAVTVFVNVAGGQNYRFTATSGDWNNPANWTPNGVPGANDSARIRQGAVTVSQATTVKVVSLEGGVIAGPGELTVTSHFTAASGQMNGLPLTIGTQAIGEFVSQGAIGFSGTLTNNGTFVFAADVNGFSTTAQNAMTSGESVQPAASGGILGFLQNLGRALFAPRPRKTVNSPVHIPAAVVRVAGVANRGQLISNDGGSLISNDGGSFAAPSAQAASTGSGFTQTAGELDLGSADSLKQLSIFGPVSIAGGSVTGSGIINGNLTNSGGFISPGHSSGNIEVTGNFTQSAGGTLVMEVGYNTSDQLVVDQTANLGGTLNVTVPAPQNLNNPTNATLFTFNKVAGSFAKVSSNATVNLDTFTGGVSVDPTKPAPQPGQPINISTRLQIQGGDNGLIAGFIITGPSGATKKVIIRGLGPSTGVPGAIADPILELNGDNVHVVNDNWQQGDTSKIPNGFAPSNPKESVIVATLTVGSQGYSGFTAGLRDTHGQLGVGVVEVYDLNADSAAQLANIATRGLVQTGENVLIGGFYVGGNEPAKMLVRATGPSLTSQGVTGELKDPLLELHDANGAVISNDNWRETQESEITATGIPPSDEREPAILATLVPGGYTAVVRGVNDTTGVAVIEAYNVSK